MNIKDYKKVYNNLKTSTYMDEQILNSVEGNHKTKKNWSFSKAAAVALACIALSTGTVSAISYALHMDSHVKDSVVQTETKSAAEKYLIENGFDTLYSTGKANTVADKNKGISIKLLETVADLNQIYVYFKVDYGKYKDQLKCPAKYAKYNKGIPNIDPLYEIYAIDNNGKKHGLSFATGGSDWHIVNEDEGTYGITVSNEHHYDIKQMIIEFQGFDVSSNTIAEDTPLIRGKWVLKWNLKYGTAGIKKTVNKEINLGKNYKNASFTIKDITITPLSYVINYSYDSRTKSIKALSKACDDLLMGSLSTNCKDIPIYLHLKNGKKYSNLISYTSDSYNPKDSTFIGYTGYVGGFENIESIELPRGNIINLK